MNMKSPSHAIEDCPMPDGHEIEPGSVVYAPPPWAEKRIGVALARHVNDATPGGIRREQFTHQRHPVKAALSALPFIALAAAAVFAALIH